MVRLEKMNEIKLVNSSGCSELLPLIPQIPKYVVYVLHDNSLKIEKNMGITAIFIIAYLATGVALIGYDFAAPPTHRKNYIAQVKLKGILGTCFFWPVTAFMDSYYSIKKGKAGLRFALGVILLFIAIFLIASLFFKLVTSASIFAFLGCLVIVVLLSPFLAALALPNHDTF